MSAATLAATPKANVAPTTSRRLGRSRRAARRAPASEPIAMTEPSRPYSPAPLSKTRRAISAVVSWKLRPKVPTIPTIARMSTRSGRRRT
jgi:hypothetical protein